MESFNPKKILAEIVLKIEKRDGFNENDADSIADFVKRESDGNDDLGTQILFKIRDILGIDIMADVARILIKRAHSSQLQQREQQRIQEAARRRTQISLK